MRAAAHHGDPIGQDERLFLVVGHEHHGGADLPVQRAQLGLDLLATGGRARRTARRTA